MNLVALVIWVLICCVVWWAVKQIMATFEVPAQIQTVVIVLLVLLFVLWLASQVGLISGGPVIRLG
jgi:hypothetical protein